LLALVGTTNTAKADNSLPQNGKIAFSSYYSSEQGESYNIYTVDPDGSSLSKLTQRAATIDIQPAWSPDGTKIAYTLAQQATSEEVITDVYVTNADGSGKTNLTSKQAEGAHPAWSPNGTRIAFSSERDSGVGDYGATYSDIYTMRADGSDVARVTKTPLDVSEIQPDWQPLTPESRSLTVHPPDTGGTSLLLVASALLFSGGLKFYAGVRRRM
jgi:Tol biopolymer transport system component